MYHIMFENLKFLNRRWLHSYLLGRVAHYSESQETWLHLPLADHESLGKVLDLSELKICFPWNEKNIYSTASLDIFWE